MRICGLLHKCCLVQLSVGQIWTLQSFFANRILFKSLGLNGGYPEISMKSHGWSFGYGSIPINTIFRGLFTSINPSYFDVNYRGTRFWPIPMSLNYRNYCYKRSYPLKICGATMLLPCVSPQPQILRWVPNVSHDSPRRIPRQPPRRRNPEVTDMACPDERTVSWQGVGW